MNQLAATILKRIPGRPADQGGRIDAPDWRGPSHTPPQLAALCRRFGNQAVAAGLRLPVLAEAV